MKYCYFLVSLLILASCNKEPSVIEFSGDTLISEPISIGENELLSVAPGSTLRFAPGATINCYSNIIIRGTEEEPITLISEDSVNDHWILEIFDPTDKFELSHINIINGLITTREAKCHFKNVHFSNDKELEWNSAATRFWGGELIVEDCVIDWNRKGEGFLVHDVNRPIVKNSTFKKVNDAVEFLGCNNGVIQNCKFLSNSDDAIDLNACYNILMADNEFYDTKDRAMEIGSEGFGHSTKIRVVNNLYVDCKIAVDVKENSDAQLVNLTIVRCKLGLEIINEENNGLISHAEMNNSVLVDCSTLSYTDESTLTITNCMSDDELIDATNSIQTSIVFADSTQHDYRITSTEFPSGLDQSTIGYQKR